jgi:cyclophilin family peptidyl-prolyl cis-trans isomerase
MVSVGRDTSGSQFYIDLGVNKHFDGRCVVFGRLISGEPVLDAIEQVCAFVAK